MPSVSILRTCIHDILFARTKNIHATISVDDSFYLLAWCRWSRDPEPPLAFMTFSFIVAPVPVGQDPIPSPQDRWKEATIS